MCVHVLAIVHVCVCVVSLPLSRPYPGKRDELLVESKGQHWLRQLSEVELEAGANEAGGAV